MACCLENGELCCGDGLPVPREGASRWVTHTHSSREPEGSVHFIIPQVWCRGLVRLLWRLSAKEKWSGIPVPTRQPLRFSMQIRASNLGLHCWLPISRDPRWRHGVKIATCVGWGWGVLEERTVTLYLGARLQKDKIAGVRRLGPSSQGCWPQHLSSWGTLRFFLFLLLNYLVKVIIFFCKKYSMFLLCQIGKF